MSSRYNLFNLIHKGLRHLLYDTALKLQRTDVHASQANEVILQLEQVLDYFEQHAHHEDNQIFTAIQPHAPELVADFEAQHAEDHQLSDQLADLIHQLKATSDAAQKNEIWQSIFYAFNEFVAFNLYHMNKEERDVNEILWTHYTDQELMQITQKIISSIKPEILMAQSRWMMRSISTAEAVAWLGGMKATAPEPVLKAFVGLAQNELSLMEWQEVQTALFQEAV